jgi:hypothetical protein
MNLDKIIAELRQEVETINNAIAALQRLLPEGTEEAAGRSSRTAGRRPKADPVAQSTEPRNNT